MGQYGPHDRCEVHKGWQELKSSNNQWDKGEECLPEWNDEVQDQEKGSEEGGATGSKTGGSYVGDKTGDESSREVADVEESSTSLG